MLLERDGKKPGQRIGKSPWLQSVIVEADAAIGEMVTVDIVSAGPNSLMGELVGRDRATAVPPSFGESKASRGETILQHRNTIAVEKLSCAHAHAVDGPTCTDPRGMLHR